MDIREIQYKEGLEGTQKDPRNIKTQCVFFQEKESYIQIEAWNNLEGRKNGWIDG